MWNPKLYVPVDGIFLLHVCDEAFPLPFLVLVGTFLHSILYGTRKDYLLVDVAVGFCNNLSIDFAWRV